MYDFPEPALEPPNDIEIASCCVCRNPIYEGEEHWEYRGQPLCLDHLDKQTATVSGCVKKDGRET